MTTHYKTFNSKIRPISLFRYPHKKWKKFPTEGYTKYQIKSSLVTQTFEINGNTIDFKFYKGDEKQFEDYIDLVLSGFGLVTIFELFDSDKSFEYDHSYGDSGSYDLQRYIVDYTSNTDHYTVLCNSCEVWGNERTKKYVEIFPTDQFKLKRWERNTLYGYFENGEFKTVENCELGNDRQPKTHTPNVLFLGEKSDRVKLMLNYIRQLDLSSEELLHLKKLMDKVYVKKLVDEDYGYKSIKKKTDLSLLFKNNYSKKSVEENIGDNSQSVKVGMEGVLQ